MLQIDASVELLRKSLSQGEGDMSRFEQRGTRMADRVDQDIAEMGKRFGVFSEMAQSAAAQMQQSFESSFTDIQRRAAEAVKMPVLANGGLNLGSADLRDAAAAAQQQAAAIGLIEDAARRAALAVNDESEATRLYIQAASAARIEAERQSTTLNQQAAAMERLEIETAQTGRAQTLFAVQNRQGVVSTGQARAGMQQLGFQIQDLGVQFAMAAGSGNVMKGVMTGLAMQGPQVVSAIAMIRGSAGGLVGFLNGPWGAAFMAATSVAAILGAQLLSTGDDAEKAAKKVDVLTDSLKALREERANQGQVGQVEKELNRLREERMNPDIRRARGETPESYARRQDAERAKLDIRIGELEQQIAWNAVAEQGRVDASERKSQRGSRSGSGASNMAEINAMAKLEAATNDVERAQAKLTLTRKQAQDQLKAGKITEAQATAQISAAETELNRAQSAQKALTKSRGEAAKASKEALREQQQLTQQYEQQSAQLADQLRIQMMRQRGLDHEADVEEARLALMRQLPKLDATRLNHLTEQQKMIIDQKYAYEEIMAIIRSFPTDLNIKPVSDAQMQQIADLVNADLIKKGSPIKQMSVEAQELARTINQDVAGSLKGMMRGFGDLGDMALNVLYSIGDALIDNLLNAGGGGEGGTGGLGGTIVKSIGSILKFDRGGYTGNAPTTAATGIVHGQEFVFDAATTSRIGVDNLEAIRRGTFRMPMPSAESLRVAGGSYRMGDTYVSVDARGAGPREVDMLNAKLDEVVRDIPRRSVEAVREFNARTYGRGLAR